VAGSLEQGDRVVARTLAAETAAARRDAFAHALPWLVGVGPAALVVVVLLVVPSAALLALSFVRFDPLRGVLRDLTAENYLTIVRGSLYVEILLQTFRVAAVVTLVCLVVGYPIAYFMARSRTRLATICAAIVVAPLFVSVVIRGFGWMVLLARDGIVNHTLLATGLLTTRQQFLYTDAAVIIGLVHILSPFMILPIASVLRGIDPAIEEAALNLGADRLRVFRWIVLPLSVPGVMAGAVLVFSHAIAAFVLPAMLGSIQTKLMATQLYQQVLVVGNVPFGAALATVLVVTTLLLLAVTQRLSGVRAW
jgi:putative spermidine/putrescine transport system permease protein